MTRVNHLDRSWILTWTLSLLTILGFIGLLVYSSLPTTVLASHDPTADPEDPHAAFRIVDVRDAYGRLVLEVQHFKANGDHWFYEVYTWEGTEEFNRLPATNAQGQLLLEDNSVAPAISNPNYNEEDIAPEDLEAYRNSVPQEVQYFPIKKVEFEYQKVIENVIPSDPGKDTYFQYLVTSGETIGWEQNQVLEKLGEPITRSSDEVEELGPQLGDKLTYVYNDGPGLQYSNNIALNEEALLEQIVSVYEVRKEKGWTGNKGRVVSPKVESTEKAEEGARLLSIRFAHLQGTTYFEDGTVFNGNTDLLAGIDDYFERVDLRTANSKTYAIGEDLYRTELYQTLIHSENENGEFLDISYDFIRVPDTDTDTWVMSHPNYKVIGTQSTLTILDPTDTYGGRWYTPSPLTFKDNTAYYYNDGLKWVYSLTPAGIKLDAEVYEPRGERDYEFTFLPLGEGIQPFRIDSEGNAVTADRAVSTTGGEIYFDFALNENDYTFEPQLVVPRAFAEYGESANKVKVNASPWKIVDDYRIKFTFDDKDVTSFPYVLDPTTTISLIGNPLQNGMMFGTAYCNPITAGNYPNWTCGSVHGTGPADFYIGAASGSAHEAKRGFIKFDLDSVPSGVVITRAYIDLYNFTGGRNYDPSDYGNDFINLHRLNKEWDMNADWTKATNSVNWTGGGASQDAWHVTCINSSSCDRDTEVSASLDPYSVTSHPNDGNMDCNCWHRWEGEKLLVDVRQMHSGYHDNYGWVLEHPMAENSAWISGNTGYYYYYGYYGYNYAVTLGNTTYAPHMTVEYTYPSIDSCITQTNWYTTNQGTSPAMWDGQVAHNNDHVSATFITRTRESETANSNANYDSDSTDNHIKVGWHSRPGTNIFWIQRGVVMYDTSDIPNDAVIVDANWHFTVQAKANQNTSNTAEYALDGTTGSFNSVYSQSINLVGMDYTDPDELNPIGSSGTNRHRLGSMTTWTNTDFGVLKRAVEPMTVDMYIWDAMQAAAGNIGPAIASESTGQAEYIRSPYHVRSLTDFGKAYINKEGITKFAILHSDDRQGDAPVWYSDLWSYLNISSSESGPMYEHKLEVTYRVPCAEIGTEATDTVTNTAVSTYYGADSNADWSYQIGNYNSGTGYKKWHGMWADSGTMAMQNASNLYLSFGQHGTAQTNWSTHAGDEYYFAWRSVVNFDTSNLPDYTQCTSGTYTGYPSMDGDYQNSYTAGLEWHQMAHGNMTGGSITQTRSTTSVGNYMQVGYQTTGTSRKYKHQWRGALEFDTSSIPANAVITDASMRLTYNSTSAAGGVFSATSLVSYGDVSYPAPNSAPHNDDFDNMDMSYPASKGIPNDNAAVSTHHLQINTYGINQSINKGVGAYTQFGLVDTRIINQKEYWASSVYSAIQFYTVEGAPSDAEKPQLTVNYYIPCDNGIQDAWLDLSISNGGARLWSRNSQLGAANWFGSGNAWTNNSLKPHPEGDLTVIGVKVQAGHATDYTSAVTSDFHKHTAGQITDEIPAVEMNWGTHTRFPFTEQGLYSVSTTGYTQIGLQLGNDYWDDEPVHNDSGWSYDLNLNTQTASATARPKLTVVHGYQNQAAFYANAIHNKVLTINTNGTTWKDPLTDSMKQDIIDGITGSLSESLSWNTAVRANMVVGEVDRTDDDTVSITFGNHSTYAPSVAETMTVVVPASATNDALANMTSPTTFQVDPVPFGFTAATPTMAPNTSALTLTLTGVGLPAHPFNGGGAGSEDVRMLKTSESDIVCTSVSGGGTSVVVSCPVTGAAVGAWDVKITESGGLNATLPANTTLFTPWSSTVNGGSFSESGSDFAVFAHDATPYFTVTPFEEVEKSWGTSIYSSNTPAAAGQDAMFVSDKTRIVVGTATNSNYLWAYEFNPSTSAFVGTPSNPTSAGAFTVNDLDIGINDNALIAATSTTPGVYMYEIDKGAAIGSFWTSTIATPGDAPGVSCNTVDINSDATYVAVGCSTTPFLHVYALTNGGAGTPAWSTKSLDPSSPPSGAVNSVQFSPDGSQIAIGIDETPYVEVYAFSAGTIGAKVSPPDTLPTGIASGVDWLNEDTSGPTALAVSHASSPYLTVYNFDTSAGINGFGDKLDDPSPPLAPATTSVNFHPNDDAIFVGQTASPYVTAYNFTGTSDDDYRVYRYMTNFDTSYLPDDAVISAATLSLYVDAVEIGTDWQMLPQIGSLASEPLVVGDYDYNNWTLAASATGLTASTVGVDAYNDIALNATGIAGISKTGISQFVLRHEEDISGTAPTVVETMDIEVGSAIPFPEDCITSTAWGEDSELVADSTKNLCNSPNVPVLKITYTSASNPIANITATFTNTTTPNADGTYKVGVLNKGPLTLVKVDGDANDVIEVDYGRVYTDTADDWNFLTAVSPAKPFKYAKSQDMYTDSTVDTGGTAILGYSLTSLPGAQMIDTSRTSPGAADDETSILMSLPDNSTDITLTVASSQSIGAIDPSLPDDLESADIVSINSDDLTGGISGNSEVPMGSWFTFIETQGAMPPGTIATFLALIGTMFAAVIAYRSFSSISATFIVTIGALAALSTMMGGVFPWWMVLTFALTGGVFVFSRRAYV